MNLRACGQAFIQSVEYTGEKSLQTCSIHLRSRLEAIEVVFSKCFDDIPDVHQMYWKKNLTWLIQGSGFQQNSMLVAKNFQTWLLIGWQHSCQPIRSHVRRSFLTNIDIGTDFHNNPGPRLVANINYSKNTSFCCNFLLKYFMCSLNFLNSDSFLKILLLIPVALFSNDLRTVSTHLVSFTNEFSHLIYRDTNDIPHSVV